MTDRKLLEDVRDALKPFAKVKQWDFSQAPNFERAATTLARVEAALAEKKDNTPMTDEQIKHMVDRFLQWKLPVDFHPDNGINFKQVVYEGMSPEQNALHWPMGTNILTATQAEAMVRYLIKEIPDQ
jgi:hypothetical protein